MKVLVVQYLISLRHALKIVAAFKVKKHAKHGYYFELTETELLATSFPNGDIPRKWCLGPAERKLLYSHGYKPDTPLFHLQVFRDKEDPTLREQDET
jgi:hypothetical protein